MGELSGLYKTYCEWVNIFILSRNFCFRKGGDSCDVFVCELILYVITDYNYGKRSS